MDTSCYLLLKRLNFEWLFAIYHQFPIGHQLILMELSPRQNKLCLLSWQVTVNNFACPDIHRRFVFRKIYVKMWWRMLTPEQNTSEL